MYNSSYESSFSWFFGHRHLHLQSCSFEIEPGPRYEVNLRVFLIAYHSLKMQLRSWSLLSKKIKTGGFQKCKVHCCNFKDFKVTSFQTLATLGFEPTPPAWVKWKPFVTHAGGVGSNPGVAKLWRLVTFKSLKLQQCTLHFLETSSLYLFGQERSRA